MVVSPMMHTVLRAAGSTDTIYRYAQQVEKELQIELKNTDNPPSFELIDTLIHEYAMSLSDIIRLT